MPRLLLIGLLCISGLLPAQRAALPASILIADSIWEAYPDSAFSLIENLLREELSPYIEGRAYFRQGRILLNKRQAYREAETAFSRAVDLLDGIYAGRAYRNLGRAQDRLGKYDEALASFRRALDIFSREKDIQGLGDTYNSLGNALKDMGEYHEASLHFYHGMALFQQLDDRIGQARINNNLGNCYVELDSIEKGLTFYRKAMYMLEGRPAMQAVARMNIARYAAPSEGIPEYHKLIAYHQGSGRVDQEAVVTTNLGHAYWATGEVEKAKNAYERSLVLAASIDDMRLIISNNAQLANIAGQEHDYDASIRYCQRAFAMSIPNFPADSLTFNPPLSLIHLKLESLHILQDKALSFLWLYRNQSHDLKDLHAAIGTFERAIEVLHAMYTASQNVEGKLSYKEHFHLLFDLTLSAYWDLWEETKDEKVIAQAFRVMEFSKASYLAERMLKDRLKAQEEISGEWLEQERMLQNRLIGIEKELLLAQKAKDQRQIESLQSQRFQALQRLRTYQAGLKKSHPGYFRMQQMASPHEPDSLRCKLLNSPNEALLNYFLGNTWMYVIQIRKDKLFFMRKALPSDFKQKISRFRSSLFGYWTLRSGCESGKLTHGLCDSLPHIRQNFRTQYQQEAFALYSFLFDEWEKDLPEKLIIMPEGILSFLPFEALLTDSLALGEKDWQSLPYLIHTYQLSYAYSATVLYEQMERESSQKASKLLAIAPFAGKSPPQNALQGGGNSQQSIEQLRSGSWGRLEYSRLEVEDIHKIWGGKVLLDEAAGKAAFLQSAARFNILHLATHAKAHDHEPWLSLLAFADTFAPLPELARAYLPAELVVLSACESGLGQLQDGEGVISLARAFTQAGARALVTTLWSVEDRATARIMTDFYSQLDAGLSKDAALRQARLEYIGSAEPEFAHPFFWAGLTASGNMQPLHRGGNSRAMGRLTGMLLLALGFGIGLWVLFRKKNHTN